MTKPRLDAIDLAHALWGHAADLRGYMLARDIRRANECLLDIEYAVERLRGLMEKDIP